MSGSCARLFLWDRAGCIVTESFDIREHPEILCEFLWRFSQTSDVGCGHDVTVEVATPEEELHFKDAVRGHVQLQLSIEGEALEKAILEHYAPGHVAAIHVLPQDCTSAPENIRRFIVSRPVVAPLYLAGRGTRGYWAMDTSDRRVVFIKDTWRNCETMPGREGDLLRHLHDQGVHYIPSVVCHGDVPDCFPEEPRLIASNEYHVTATDEFRTYPWVCQVAGQMVTVYKQAHYRVVLGTVGYGLRNFRDTEELLHSTYDVFTAMREASTKASRIHRDISLGNIVLVREPGRTIRRGYLIDWESSYEVDESGQALIPGRSGTWLFMSQRMLSHVNAYARQTLADDMESLLYVILYPALRWLPHDYPDYELPDLLQRFFEARTEIRGISHGGNHKLANAVCRATTREIDFKDASFQEWLNTVMDYHSPPEPLEEAYAGRWSDPSHLDRYWSEFLQTHQLARNDRLSTCSRASSSPNSVTSTVDEEDRDASSIPSSLGKRREAPNPPSFLSEQLPKRTRRASARRPQQDLEASASRRSLRKRQSATSAQGVATNDHAPLRQRLRRRTAPAHGKQDVIPNDAPSRRGSRRRA
ncbi:hypothetical protein BD309DRAFT_874324 [Dichomitus squalens]|uniref:Uncharacterized protein n=1 Tax=Dichomitus squalens TaxID=114155 RepID=A0A4Q9Q0T9_9APHY|nr:hypothetical protein BD309DRAFT_874324 [Dichomitus squalens]TBU60426.1 hypothetical protein BD310DRAFT_815282 [Dichomitus squalens]